jgi:hypothetical protein
MRARKHNPRNEKPISLHPLNLEDALKTAMQTKPHNVQKTSSTSKQSNLEDKQENKSQ